MNTSTVLTRVLLASFLTMAPLAKPDFSGDWTMSAARSDFGPLPVPTSITRTITHADPSITIVEQQDSPMGGDQKMTRAYTTDGREVAFQSSGFDVKSSAVWDGDALVVVSDVNGAGVRFIDRMTLSDDGQTMTSKVHLSSAQGDADLTIVFERKRP